MINHKINILATGFEPFGGSEVNPSAELIRALAATEIEGSQIHIVELPVDHRQAPLDLIEKFEKVRPDVVICLGEARKRAAISIERVAVNLMDFRIPDNKGNQVVDEEIIKGGPAAYFATVPVRRMLQAVQAVGIPVELSLSAGSYLCNQVMYVILHHIFIENTNTLAGFIHLPSLPEQTAKCQPPIPTMSLETSLNGVLAAINSVVNYVNRA